jgi:NifU-like protein involved in Fe-S cluster formation
MAYSPVVNDHFLNPRNVGPMEAPDAQGQAGSPQAGEFAVLHLRLRRGRIAEARFQTFGCGPAIAACSLVTEWVKGKRVEQARALTCAELVEMLGGLPEDKLFCAELALGALGDALAGIT